MTDKIAGMPGREAELERLDTFAQNITLSMSTAAAAAGYGTENGKLLGRWYHAINSELGRIRRVFLHQAEENAEMARQLEHPVVYPPIKVDPHFTGLKLRVAITGQPDAIAELTQVTPELVREYGLAYLAMADRAEQMQNPEHPDHKKLIQGRTAAADFAAKHPKDK